MAERKLTPKQKLFVEEYLCDLNASAAAKRAGYSEKRAGEIGYQLLQKTTIQAAIDEAQKQRAARTEITQDWVLTRLKEVAERCMQHEEVLDREGNPTGEYRFEHTGANKALELIGKHLAMFTDKKEITGADGGAIKVQLEGELAEWAK